MKAYQVQDQAKNTADEPRWKLVSLSDPRPGPNEVLVRVRAVSLNYRDLMVARGQYGQTKKDLIPLSDGAGEIIELGSEVKDFKVGDRVASSFFQDWVSGPIQSKIHRTALGAMIDGMLAEKVVLKASGVVRFPEHLTCEEAATLPCAGVTAWNALMETTQPLRPGSTVLTLGTGGVSTFAVLFAKAAGCTVIGTSSSDSKLNRLREMGVNIGINYKTYPEWHQEVLRNTNGEGVDQVIEVGGSKTISSSFQSVKMGGTVSIIGVLSGVEETIGPRQLLTRGIRAQGIFVGSVTMFEAMNRAITSLQIKPILDRVFQFDEAPAALQFLESGSHFGKIVIRV